MRQIAEHVATKTKPTPPAAEQSATLVFLVQHTPLLHDGVLYLPGDAVELTEAQAQKQGGNLVPVPAEPEKE